MDIFVKARKEDYKAYKEDVDIAIGELSKMKLYPIDGKKFVIFMQSHHITISHIMPSYMKRVVDLIWSMLSLSFTNL